MGLSSLLSTPKYTSVDLCALLFSYQMAPGQEKKVAKAAKEVAQLKKELEIERVKISVTAAELLQWVESKQAEDYMLRGTPGSEMAKVPNPFRETKSFCGLF